jgi:hypothetical protein
VEVSETSKERGAVGFTDLGGLLLNQLLTGGHLEFRGQEFATTVSRPMKSFLVEDAEETIISISASPMRSSRTFGMHYAVPGISPANRTQPQNRPISVSATIGPEFFTTIAAARS